MKKLVALYSIYILYIECALLAKKKRSQYMAPKSPCLS